MFMIWAQLQQLQILGTTTYINNRTAWKRLRDRRKSKWSRERSATLIEILVSG